MLDVAGGVKIGLTENEAPGTIRFFNGDFEGYTAENGWQSLTVDKMWTHAGENIFPALQGNVGIGTSEPGEKLHVNGNAIINGNLNLYGELGTTNILVDGNIFAMTSLAVGTSAPVATFQVEGSKAWKVDEVFGSITLDETHNVVSSTQRRCAPCLSRSRNLPDVSTPLKELVLQM
jgi:hypothetical protein